MVFFFLILFIYALYKQILLYREKEYHIHKKAYYDSLTDVYNRYKFNEEIDIELTRNFRHERGLSIALIDIDNFKIFNDTYGHFVGDEVLVMLAQYIDKAVRKTDTFARWGGEEFVILFPESTKEEASRVCEKLREGINSLRHAKAGGFHVSIGITQYADEDDSDTMLKRCDDALYEAKETGRNKVCIK